MVHIDFDNLILKSCLTDDRDDVNSLSKVYFIRYEYGILSYSLLNMLNFTHMTVDQCMNTVRKEHDLC